MPSENLISVFLNKIDGWGRKKIFFHIACLTERSFADSLFGFKTT